MNRRDTVGGERLISIEISQSIRLGNTKMDLTWPKPNVGPLFRFFEKIHTNMHSNERRREEKRALSSFLCIFLHFFSFSPWICRYSFHSFWRNNRYQIVLTAPDSKVLQMLLLQTRCRLSNLSSVGHWDIDIWIWLENVSSDEFCFYSSFFFHEFVWESWKRSFCISIFSVTFDLHVSSERFAM